LVNLIQTTRPDAEKITEPQEIELGQVKTWSYSALKVYEECAYRTYIARVKKIQEPSGPAADRGTLIHQAAEDFVKGKRDTLIPELKKHYEQAFLDLREEFKAGRASLEGEWGYTIDWATTGWVEDDTWARIKLDAIVMESDTSARVIDYKSGKRYGNEIAHGQQGLLYAIGTFMRFPVLEHVTTEFWYVDQDGNPTTKPYTRDTALMFMPGWHKRGVKMTTEKEFNPSPSKHTCRWCSFKDGDVPECKWGVK